jgi:hypothetical protein
VTMSTRALSAVSMESIAATSALTRALAALVSFIVTCLRLRQ